MKQLGKIYSAVDAEELEVGDIVLVSDEPIHILQNDEYAEIGIIHHIHQNYCDAFYISETCCKHFAKLICPKKHAGIYWAFQNGAKIERYCYDDDYEDGEWCLDNKPFWYEDFEYRVAELPKGLH